MSTFSAPSNRNDTVTDDTTWNQPRLLVSIEGLTANGVGVIAHTIFILFTQSCNYSNQKPQNSIVLFKNLLYNNHFKPL